jgi:flavin-dependent dehydrogenase
VTFSTADGPREIACRTLIVADGVRSSLGRKLGRIWHRDTVFGVAARGYATSGRSDDPWITAYVELRDENKLTVGYGWVFPLGNGEVNLGVAALATAKRPANIALKPLLTRFESKVRDEWQLGPAHNVSSALLPMGGSVSGVAGRNWALVGDAAGCVYPLSGEGIDYALEGGRLVADVLDQPDLRDVWPRMLREHFGPAFSMARRMAGFSTRPGLLNAGGPVGMRTKRPLPTMMRIMGNFVTDDESDFAARAWRRAGRASLRFDRRPPFA